MLDYFVPLFLILLAIIGLTVYTLTIALRDSMRQITKINEQLLVLLGTRDGGEAVGRALVASARLPKKEIPGVSKKEEKSEEPKGVKFTVGYK